MIHNSKQLTRNVHAFIRTHVTMDGCYDVSDVKQDGTVFIRFRSSETRSSMEHAELFNRALHSLVTGEWVQTDDRTFRVPLEQFAVQNHQPS